jgi:hypothetical protein
VNPVPIRRMYVRITANFFVAIIRSKQWKTPRKVCCCDFAEIIL